MIRVTDQALLRYLERVEHLDVEAVRTELEARFARLAVAADSIGGGDYSIRSEGHEFIVRGGRVTTVLPQLGKRTRYRAIGVETD